MDKQEVDSTVEDLRKRYAKYQKENTKVKVHIPHRWQYPLIWTIFFIILGIIVQSIQENQFIFLSFFTTNFINWIQSWSDLFALENFTFADFFLTLLKGLYYIGYCLGVLALIWELLATLIKTEVKLENKPF